MSDQELHVAFVSWGNDSIAMVQRLADLRIRNVICAYNDTGWSAPWWSDRVDEGEAFAWRCGYRTHRIASIGMQQLVQLRKGWPSNQHQFCTSHLKVQPALAWLSQIDPDADATCCVGVRREESARRAAWPEWTEESPGHGSRSLWAPLVRVTASERNDLVKRAGFEVLAHRSAECWPCVNANRSDLRLLPQERIEQIEAMEAAMGLTSKGKPRTMYRPGRFQGAVGIREVKRWADSDRGQYDPAQAPCDSGWCGS